MAEPRNEDLMEEEGLPEEVPEETPPLEPGAEEGAPPPIEEGAPPAPGMQHTVEEIPELAGKNVGDTITLSISEISEDGSTYTLAPVGEEGAPGTEEAAPGGGREAIKKELLV